METRASYTIVGAFTLLTIVGILLFVLWAVKNEKGDMRTYKVAFYQSVSGLSVGGGVQLEGVRVGQVTSIKVSPDDPGKVLVLISVAADAPIRQNSVATLEPQGVTGISVVAVSGGSKDSPLLTSVVGPGEIAEIPSTPSRLQQIMNSMPSILSHLDSTVERLNQLLAKENTERIGVLISSLAEISETIAQNKASLAKGMAGFGDAGDSFAKSGKRLEALMTSAQNLVDKDLRGAARSIDSAARKTHEVVDKAEPGMLKFSRESVEEVHRLLVEARRLMTGLSRLAQKIESDPRRFLLGNSIPEFSAP